MEEEKKEIIDKPTTLNRVSSFFKMVLKSLLYFILALFVLNSILYVVLSIPFIQNKLVHFASQELSSMLNTEVTVSEVRLSLFNKVSVKDLYVEDQSQDTLVYAHSLGARINPINLILQNKLKINKVELDDFFINVNAPDSISNYNFQFIVDSFSSDSDTTKVDTTSSAMAVVIDGIKISRGRLAYKIKTEEETPEEFNPSDIYVTDFEASVSIRSIDMEQLDIHINDVSAKEKSGLEISKLQGHVLSDSSRIRVESLLLALPNSHLATETVFYDLKTDEFGVSTTDTEIAPSDLIAFLPSLKHLDQPLNLEAHINGKLPSVTVDKVVLTYGREALLEGDAFITSYEDLENTDLGLRINKLELTPKGVESFAKLGDETFVRPAMLDTLGRVSLQGNLSGKLKDLHLKTSARVKPGSLQLVADGRIDTTFTKFAIKANLNTKGFDLVPFVGPDAGIGKLSAHIDLDANQRGEGTLEAKLKGRIDSLEVMHGAVESLPFAAYYNPKKMGFGVDAKLHFGQIMAGLEMTTADKPDIKFAMRVKNVDVDHFYENKYWNKPMLNFDVRGELIEFDIDDLNANILIKDLKFADTDFNYEPGPITLTAWKDFEDVKYISLNSALVTANLKGQYKFSTLMDEYEEMMHKYLPNVFSTDKTVHQHHHGNDFVFDFTLQNTEKLGYILDLPLDIVKPLTVKGEVDIPNHRIDIDGRLPLARTSSLEFKDVQLYVANLDSLFSISLNTGMGMNGGNYNLDLDVRGLDNQMRSTFTISSDAKSISLNGRIDATGEFTLDEKGQLVSTFEVIPTGMEVGKFFMNILPAKIVQTGDRIKIDDVGIGVNDQKYLDINGYISPSDQDSLFISFEKAQIADLLQGFNVNDIYAEIDGDIVATNLMNAPELYTKDFKIKDITLYKDTLGTINLNTIWSSEKGGINLYSNMVQRGKQVAMMEGIVKPISEEVNLHVDVERFPVDWAKPFAEGILSDISGDISSHFTIKGKFNAPVTEGFLGFNNMKIKLDYTNVSYYISDTIDITPDRIGFDNLVLRDNEGNMATANARLTHRNFKDVKYNLRLRASNLMVLNTQSRTDSLFYGKLFASGNIRIDGNDQGINLDMDLRNGKKSNLNVTIPQVSEASEYKSVVFINIPEDKLPKEDTRWRREERQAEEDIPIKLKVKLAVDPELSLGVIIDPVTGDKMNVKGKGTIDFNYDMSKNLMTAFGDYNITDGLVRLNLQNISKLEFKIKEGSKLNFIGDPFNTKFDIVAYRRARADLRTLDISFEQDNASPRVQVDCLLGIAGDINKMDLTYDIELVGATEDQVRKVKSLVNTDEIKIKQFAYLVASGTFYSNTGSSGANFSDGMWTSLASTALSSGLNAVFGNMLGDSWEFAADISDNDKSVMASTHLLDNKLKLSANVGMRSESNATASDNSFIGDFDAEYKLNSIWTLKAYSHTNDRFYRQAPTTQGVGIVYTREGATFKRMFQTIGRRRGKWFKQERRKMLLEQDSLKMQSDSLQLEKTKAEPVSEEPVVQLIQNSHQIHATEPKKVVVNAQPALKEEDED